MTIFTRSLWMTKIRRITGFLLRLLAGLTYLWIFHSQLRKVSFNSQVASGLKLWHLTTSFLLLPEGLPTLLIPPLTSLNVNSSVNITLDHMSGVQCRWQPGGTQGLWPIKSWSFAWQSCLKFQKKKMRKKSWDKHSFLVYKKAY